MKSFLQNLLILFALSLCALISFQWVRETALRKDVQGLNDTIHDKMENIQNLQAGLRRDEAEITRLDTLKNQLNSQIKTNMADIAALTKDLDQLTNKYVRVEQQLEVYKDAVKKANDTLRKQNDDIKKQNEDMAKLAEDRNEVVKKFNKVAQEYNDLVTKWNSQQEELAKSATNAPPKTNAPPRK